jgi:3',5'-cyclic-AMP phosphodiesterase
MGMDARQRFMQRLDVSGATRPMVSGIAAARRGAAPRRDQAMLIAQISDLHLLPKGTLAFGRVDVAGCLERAIDRLNALQPQPDAVLITGDLTNDGDAAVWAELIGVLGRLRAPVYPLPGNHDDRELMRAAFAPLELFPAHGPLCFDVGIGPVRLIGLDSLIPGDPAGRLGPEQLAWLDARLEEAPEKPTLVALHHPPFRTGIDHMDAMMLEDGDALAAVIGRHRQVERVLCGHVHRSVQCRFAGTLAQIAAGTAHAVQLALAGEPSRWVMEPPGVLLHEWRGEHGLVSHLDFIGDFEVGEFSDQNMPAPGYFEASR